MTSRLCHTARATGVMARRDLKIALSYRLTFVLGILNGFWSLVVFRFLSELIDPRVVPRGSSYFEFVVVGLALSRVLDACLAGAQTTARKEQTEGTLEAIAVQPVSTAGLGLGWSCFPAVQALAFATANIALAVPMGMQLDHPNWGAGVVVLLLSLAAFVGLGLLGASLVIALQQGLGFSALLGVVLPLVSGIYYPLRVLPGWLRALARLSPLTHSVNALRDTMLHGLPISQVLGEIGILAAFVVVLVPLGLASLRMSFAVARRRGILGSY